MLLKRLLFLIFCYLLGSINTALFITYLFKHVDIRTLGNGNAGTTNVFQNVNKFLGVLVFFIDFFKGMLPFYIGSKFMLQNGLVVIGGSLVVLGHDFPLFYGFNGGTGNVPLLGGMFCIDYRIVIEFFIICILVIAFFSLFKIHLFGASYLDETETFGFGLTILLIIITGSTLLKEYFFLSFFITALRHWDKVTDVFSKILSFLKGQSAS